MATSASPEPTVSATAKPSASNKKAAPDKTTKKAKAGATSVAAKEPAVKKPAPKKDAPPRVKKVKPVRDSFTFPKDEYEVIGALKQRTIALACPAKKSELLRAGIKVLAAMSDKDLLSTLSMVPAIKTGRPKKP